MSQGNADSPARAVIRFAGQLGLEPEVLVALRVRPSGNHADEVQIMALDHHGAFVSAQQRNLDTGQKRWPKDGKQWTFGANEIDPLEPLIIVEGAIDWLLCRSMKYNVVGLPSATFSVENADWLDQFHECEEWIVLNEGGNAATKMLKALADSRYADRITVFTLGGYDIFDVWKREDRDPMGAKVAIDQAVEERVSLNDRLAPQGIENLRSTEQIRSVRWGGHVWTAQYVTTNMGGRIDLRVVRDDDDRLVRRESLMPTGKSISDVARMLGKTNLVPSGESVEGLLEDLVYGLLAEQARGESLVENLFTVEDDEDKDEHPLLVGPTVVRGAAAAIIGPTGSSKTISGLAQSLVAVSGQSVGPFDLNGEPERVYYLDGEWAKRDIREIAAAIGRGHDIDVPSLEREGMIGYYRLKGPIIDNPEPFRRTIEEGGFGLVVVDSVDTARGPDATNQSGQFYDMLRYFGGSSLAIDHVSKDVAKKPMKDWDALGSVRSINRPRQTWAVKASGSPKEGKAAILMRLNYVNRGVPGVELSYDIDFEMRNGRFHEIRFSAASAIRRAAPTNQERVLIAIHQIGVGGGMADVKSIVTAAGLADNQVNKANSGLRDKGWITKENPPTVREGGVSHLTERWPDGEYPEIREDSE